MKIVFSCTKDFNTKVVFQKVHFITSICKDALFKKISFEVVKKKDKYYLKYKVKRQKDFDNLVKSWLRLLARNLKKEKYFKGPNMKPTLDVEHWKKKYKIKLKASKNRRKRRRIQ